LQAAGQAAEQAGWRRHVRAATDLARESLTEARRSVDALRPASLENAGLGDALAAVGERWSSLHGIPVQVTTTGTAQPLAQQPEFVLLRTVQEALANVAKHAHASRVGLTLPYLPGEVATGRPGRRPRVRPGRCPGRRVRAYRHAAAGAGPVRPAAD
jgi:signal transduction histidine kinase